MVLRQRSILDDHMVVVHHNKATVEAALTAGGWRGAREVDFATFSEREESRFSTQIRVKMRGSIMIDFRQPRKRELWEFSCDVMSGFLAGFCWKDMTLFAIEEHAHVCVCVCAF